MKVTELEVGRMYCLKVDSAMGYEDYYYTGETHPNPSGGLNYCFKMMGGYYWFDEEGIKPMIATKERDWWMVFNYTSNELLKKENK